MHSKALPVILILWIILAAVPAVFAADAGLTDTAAAFYAEIFREVNDQRVKNHVGEVQHDDCLDAAAEVRSTVLAEAYGYVVICLRL